ncbi:MAG: protein phosphatase 2C domain-containing protein [Anaerolineales bacterium]
MRSLFQRPQKHTAPTSKQAKRVQNNSMANSWAMVLEPRLQSAYAQSPGLQRDYNEDALLALDLSIGYQDIIQTIGIYAIADGMGGHLHGEIASKVAISSIASSLLEHLLLPQFNPTIPKPPNSYLSILKESVLLAHQEVLDKASGGGTTLTCSLIVANTITIAHIGDSRAYHISEEGEVKLYTRDHSLVKRLVELGQISEKEAQTHPQRNVLYRALGQTDPVEVDVFSLPTPSSGHLLLCSDGLWGVVSESQIAQTLHQSRHLQEACHRLIQMANEAGGPDNISIILVKFLNTPPSE